MTLSQATVVIVVLLIIILMLLISRSKKIDDIQQLQYQNNVLELLVSRLSEDVDKLVDMYYIDNPPLPETTPLHKRPPLPKYEPPEPGSAT